MKKFKKTKIYSIFNEESKFSKPKYYTYIGTDESGYNFKAIYNLRVLHIPFSELNNWSVKEDSIGPSVEEIIRQELKKLLC